MQLRDGALTPGAENCVMHASMTWKERAASDTNPLIVQAFIGGVEKPYYYYRSDEWVDQPLFHEQDPCFTPYVGPAESAPVEVYGVDKFKKADSIMFLLKKGVVDDITFR